MSDQNNLLINSQDSEIIGRWQKTGGAGPLDAVESRALWASPWYLHPTPQSSNCPFLVSTDFLLGNEEPAL